MDLVKVIVLGAPGVGKTSIVQQFIWNEFTEEYRSTERKQTYYPSVIINDHLYELKISDLPAIPYFPTDSFYEWAEFRFHGLRSATAYILVFDISDTDTFQYIRTIRDQIAESRDMKNVPLLVVGNKQDLLVSPDGDRSHSGQRSGSSYSSSGNIVKTSVPCSTSQHHQPAIAPPFNYNNDRERDKRRDIVNLVKKHWKCGYVECSARYNWRVVAIFKELMKTVDALEPAGPILSYKEVCSPMIDNIHEALDRNKCSIF